MRKVRLTWTSAALAASLLALGACADVDANDGDDFVDRGAEDHGDLAQLFPTRDAGTAATSGSDAGAGGAKWADREDLGRGTGKDVITLGDSWVNLIGGGIGPMMARQFGYTDFAVAGTTLNSGQIPSQWDSAHRRIPDIKTVIMTGGGNDVLLNPVATAACQNPSCSTLVEIRKNLKTLWEKMGAQGVKDIVYLGYAEGAGSSPPQVTNTSKNGISELCDSITSVNCHWIDSTPIVRGRFRDGIHPTDAANRDLITAIQNLMKERKIRR